MVLTFIKIYDYTESVLPAEVPIMLEICVLMAIASILFGSFLFFVALVSAGWARQKGACKGLALAGFFFLLVGAIVGYVTWMEIEESAYAKKSKDEADMRIIR